MRPCGAVTHAIRQMTDNDVGALLVMVDAAAALLPAS